MESMLAYIILGTGWPILIFGSLWAWKHSSHLQQTARTFMNVAIGSFFLLAYSSTMYLTDQPWLLAVIPVFVFFAALMTIVVLTLKNTSS